MNPLQTCVLTLLILPGGFLFPTTLGQAEERPAAAAVVPEAKSYEGLKVSLKIESDKRVFWNEMDVLIKFSCSKGTHRILNTSMSPLMDLPGDIVIRDSTGKEVNRITDRNHGSRITPSPKDHLRLGPGEFALAKVHIHSAHNREADEWLGDGEFTMQFEMRHGALGLIGDHRSPIVRSELVKFRLGEKKPK